MGGLLISEPVSLSVALSSPNIIPGDTILLRGGVYTTGDIVCGVNNVTIKPYNNETVVLRPLSGYRILLFGSMCHDVVLDGLLFDGENVVECLKITDGATNISLKNCEIRNANKNSVWGNPEIHPQGILISGYQTNEILVENCNIHNNGFTGYDHGIYCSGAGNVIVRKCDISHNGGHGIHIFGSNDASINIIDSNYVHHNGEYGIGTYYGYALIKNNVVRYNTFSGIRVAYNVMRADVFNNTSLNHPNGPGIVLAGLQKSMAVINVENNVSINNSYGVLVDISVSGQEININNNLYSGNTANNYQNNSGPTTSTPTLLNNVISVFVPTTDNGSDIISPSTGNPSKSSGNFVASVLVDKGDKVRSNPPTIGAWE